MEELKQQGHPNVFIGGGTTQEEVGTRGAKTLANMACADIGFSIDDAYSQHCGALIASILKNSTLEDDYKFYIVHKFISDENKAKLEELKKIRNFEILELYICSSSIFFL